MPQDDAHYVNRSLAGDRDAYGELVRRYQHAVFALALSRVRHFADAEDIAQEALVAAYEDLGSLRDPQRFGPWLRTSVANLCRNWRRRGQRAADSAAAWGRQMDGRQVDPPDGAVEAADLRTRVLAAIARLPAAQRQAVALFYIDGLSSQQIGSFLGVSPNTVDQRLHRAREQLKEEMIDMVEQVLKSSQPPEFPEKVLEEIAQRARAALARQDRRAAVEHYDAALERLEALEEGDARWRWQADLLYERSRAAYFLERDEGDGEARIEAVEAAVEFERKLGDRGRYAARLMDLALDYTNARRYNDALARLREAESLFGELGQTDRQAWTVFWIGRLLIPWRPGGDETPDAGHGRALSHFRRSFDLFDGNIDPLGRAQAVAAVSLLETLGPDATDPAIHNFAATALCLEYAHGQIRLQAQPGFSHSKRRAPGQALELMNKPPDWLHLPVERGASWTSPAFAYGTETLSATSRVVRLDAVAETPAGVFHDCLELLTRLERTGHDPNESYRRLNQRNSGVRTALFAPGVGILRLNVEHGDGTSSHAQLTACTVPEGAEGYLPLVPGAAWDYAVTNSTSDLTVRDHYRVVDRRGSAAYLAQHAFAEGEVRPVAASTGRAPRQSDTRRWSDGVQALVGCAGKEAARLRHDAIGTEDLLLGILASGADDAIGLLQRHGINLPALQEAVRACAGPRRRRPPGDAPLSPRATHVLASAEDETDGAVQPVHVLLALLRDRDGVAGEVLTEAGLDYEVARAAVIATPDVS